VFAKQSDFGAAEKVLRAAEQNSQDMLPVYEGFTQVLALREAARFEESVAVPVSTAEVDDDLSGVDVAQVGRFSP